MIQEKELDRKAVTIAEAMRITGLGRNSIYELVHEGKIRAIRKGKKWIIPIAAIDDYLQAT